MFIQTLALAVCELEETEICNVGRGKITYEMTCLSYLCPTLVGMTIRGSAILPKTGFYQYLCKKT
jgi:hypothetical protein